MTARASAPTEAFARASLAAALFAIDPLLSGVSLRAPPGPVRDAWLALLRAYLPEGAPMRRAPLAIADDRLLGGLDLAATLRAGAPIIQAGLIAQTNGGVLLLAMAERLTGATAARFAAALDTGRIDLARDGFSSAQEARIGVVALDEGHDPDERPPEALLDRLAFHLDVTNIGPRDIGAPSYEPEEIAAARARFPAVLVPPAAIASLVTAAAHFGVDSLRAPLLARRVARAACALRGASVVEDADLEIAASYVFAPRATCLPAQEEERPEPQEPQSEKDRDQSDAQNDNQSHDQQTLEDVVIDAVRAALPPDLLAKLTGEAFSRAPASRSGPSGDEHLSARRGRPLSARRGELRHGRLSLIDTLRAAAPWQKLRRAEMREPALAVHVVTDDFRIKRFRERRGTTAIFVVDASGSSAMRRLAEVKGAIELMLADCYVRRDNVALVVFRGKDADVILPPTRSLARAKRLLASMPGGGGTPLARGLDTAAALADSVKKKGQTPLVILLTDGKANIDRAGEPGRARAFEDALAAAKQMRVAGHKTLAVDSAANGGSGAEAPTRKIADAMQARYLRLPFIDAARLSQAVRAAVTGP